MGPTYTGRTYDTQRAITHSHDAVKTPRHILPLCCRPEQLQRDGSPGRGLQQQGPGSPGLGDKPEVIKALESILADKLEAKEEAKLAKPLPDLPGLLLEMDKGKDKLKRVKVEPPAAARPPPAGRGICCGSVGWLGISSESQHCLTDSGMSDRAAGPDAPLVATLYVLACQSDGQLPFECLSCSMGMELNGTCLWQISTRYL